ncbi:hypothetical protein ABXV18_27035 [Vibrio owensii]|uniref:hypothetical protein n=1 Tax=Vibrio owensii TaxID=696485 RepID=UPI00339ACAD8
MKERKPNGYWTKEACHDEALKYQSRNEFKKGSGSARIAAYRKGWLDEICSHMVKPQSHRVKWTKEACRDEALKYQYRVEFQKGSKGAYSSARKNGWLDDVCSHMSSPIKKPTNLKWTKEACRVEALKYKTRFEFTKGSRGAYNSALKNDWLNEICAHMETPKNRRKNGN